MSHPIIENYLATSYNRWIRYCEYQCRLRDVDRGNHEDIYHDILTRFFSTYDEQTVIDMITRQVYPRYSLFDIYITRAIKYQVFHYRRDTFSCEKVFKHVGEDVSFDWFRAPEPDSYERFDLYEAQQKAAMIIKDLNVPLATKELLNEVLVENNQFKELKGAAHGNKSLVFNDGLHEFKMAVCRLNSKPTDEILSEYAPYVRTRMSEILNALSMDDKNAIAQKVGCTRNFVDGVLLANQKQTTPQAMAVIAEAKAQVQRNTEIINSVDPAILKGNGGKLTHIMEHLRYGDHEKIAEQVGCQKLFVKNVLCGRKIQTTPQALAIIKVAKEVVADNKRTKLERAAISKYLLEHLRPGDILQIARELGSHRAVVEKIVKCLYNFKSPLALAIFEAAKIKADQNKLLKK